MATLYMYVRVGPSTMFYNIGFDSNEQCLVTIIVFSVSLNMQIVTNDDT